MSKHSARIIEGPDKRKDAVIAADLAALIRQLGELWLPIWCLLPADVLMQRWDVDLACAQAWRTLAIRGGL